MLSVKSVCAPALLELGVNGFLPLKWLITTANKYRKYLFIKKRKLTSVQKCYIILLGGETDKVIRPLAYTKVNWGGGKHLKLLNTRGRPVFRVSRPLKINCKWAAPALMQSPLLCVWTWLINNSPSTPMLQSSAVAGLEQLPAPAAEQSCVSMLKPHILQKLQ